VLVESALIIASGEIKLNNLPQAQQGSWVKLQAGIQAMVAAKSRIFWCRTCHMFFVSVHLHKETTSSWKG